MVGKWRVMHPMTSSQVYYKRYNILVFSTTETESMTSRRDGYELTNHRGNKMLFVADTPIIPVIKTTVGHTTISCITPIINFTSYQMQAIQFAKYQYPFTKNIGRDKITIYKYLYPLLELSSEVGELQSKLKKQLRGESMSCKEDIINKLGDIFWVFTMLATELDITLIEVAEENIKKLQSRKARRL